MNLSLKIRRTVTIITAVAFYLSSIPVQAVGIPPLSLSQMYAYAAEGNVRGLRVALQRGLRIDSVDRRGNTGLCHAITQNNYTAYNAFRSAGANPRHPCIQNIPNDQYDQFMASNRAAPITASPREAYRTFGEGEYIVSKSTWIIGGLLLVGGVLAVALSGGGGGSSSPAFFPEPYYEPTDSLAKFVGTQVPTAPESRPYSAVIYSAFNGETIVNKKSDTSDNNFSITNNSTTKIFNKETNLYEDKKLVDIIDLNGNILEHTAYLQVAMKARKNATVENGTDADGPNVPVITLGDATAGLVANDRSFAKNYATIKTLAQNGAISMIAGNHSVATNMGEIDLGFKGIKDSDSVIGMYADTYSSIINNGNISGNTIDSGIAGATPTNAAGTIIGMEVRTINEVPYPSSTPPVTASNNMNITLNTTSDTNPIGTSLVGMGGYLDKAFLDGTKLIRRASSLYLNNLGDIKLTYTLSGTGTYVSNTNTLLNGMGGIVGIRADAKTTAINDGNINVLLTTGVNNAATGMLAVHGGTLTNNGDINVTGGEGNYGMLSVRGKGNNAEIDSLTPTLLNNGNIHVISTNGYGMASYNGGVVTNAGNILLDNVGTGMRTNIGILDNKNTITLNNSGQGMVIKSNDPIVVNGGTGDAGGTGGTGDAGGTGGTDDAGGTGTTVKEDLSKAQATNNGLITINNADNAQGIFIEDGKATNNGTGIKITNTSRVPAASSYGIKAEKGTVDNNSLIDMNVLVSADGSISVDSYGIFTDSANINNNVNGSVVFRKRGTGIASTSGRITNLGKITLEQGGTGIKSGSGDVYNAGEIIINDNDTAISTGIEAVAGKISNTGKITITGGNGATGIKAGLLVDNRNTIQLNGRNITGIELTGKDAIANNYSDIIITSTGLSSADKFSHGIKAGSSAVNATIKNFNNITMTGTTSITNKEKGYGIFIADGSAYNYGNITFNNMYGWGMYTTAGTLINDANITLGSGGFGMYGSGAESQLMNNAIGRINITVPKNDNQSDSYGMYASGGAIAINKGIISVNTDTNPSFMLSKSYGIYVDSGNAINQGKINIIGSNSTGIAYAGNNSLDTIKNDIGGVINLDGSKLIGMSNSGGTSINAGIINLGTNTTSSTAPNSIGMQTTGGVAVNQNTINVNSQNSVGLQSDGADAMITNNGTINISSIATGSYGILSNAGTAKNGTGGIINSNISNTDIMRATNGTIINEGRLEIKDPLSNVNAMHVTEQGTATNALGALIMVGTSAGASGTNNTGVLLDKEGSTGINNGTITVYSKDSFGMKSDNANSTLLNNSTITVMPRATGSVALYIVPDTNPGTRRFMRANIANSLLVNNGTINIMAGATGSIALSSVSGDIINTQKAIINMYASGIIMRTFDGTMTNEGVLALTLGNSTAMYVIDAGKAINRGSITVNGANSNAMYAEGTGTLQNIKTITVNGANSNAMKSDDGANATISNSGTINLNNGATNAKGIYNASGTSTNETSGIINVLQSAATALYTQSGKLYNKGLINLSATNAIGIHVNGTGMGENVADGIINVNNSGTRALYVSGAGNVVNNGIINMNANNAFGLYAENGGTATNNSNISLGDTLTGSYAMYGQNNATLINTGTIKLGAGGSYGIYAKDSSVNNSGTISINSNIGSSGIMAINTSGGGNISNSGDISVVSGSGSSAYGINVTTASSINVNNSGNVDIAASGGSGKAYGISVNGAANITNTSSGVINVTADSAYGMMLNGSGTATNQGNIIVTDSISGGLSSYGMYASSGGSLVNGAQITVNSDRGVGMYIGGSGSASNSGTIAVNDNGSGNAVYGMQANGSGTLTNSGSINVTGGTAYGMYSSGGASLNNTSQITVSGGSTAYGMYVNGSGSANNSGTLNVSGGSAYGMYVNGSGTATNSGTINVSSSSAYGMYAINGGSIVNNSSATINVTGGGVGMYADGSGSSITNNGNIIINGSSVNDEHPGESTSEDPDPDPVDNPTGCTASGCGDFIKVSNGATFTNNAVVRSYSVLDFNSMIDDTSSIELGKGGSFEAPEISGRVRAAASIVQEGNAKTYTNENSFIGEDEGIILDSGSYLFDVRLVKNADGNHDVLMNMKNFQDVVDNQKIAGFLSANYDLGNRLDIFSDLKGAATAEAFGKTTADQLGLNLMPSFAKQNLDIIKALDRHLNTALFNNNAPKDLRASINYAYDTRKQDGIDMLSGYEDEAHSIYGLFDRKYNNNFRYGFGLSLTDYSSEYDHGAKRDEVIAQVLAPLVYEAEGLKALSMPRIGFGWGEYKRHTELEEFKADTKNVYYGITNEVRKDIPLGPVTLEPTAEFNVLGLHQGQTKEDDNLEINSSNNISVEGGIGLYAKKTFMVRDKDELKIRVGGTYYHEFNNPYQAAKARISGMAGSYQMDSYDADRDRAVLSCRLDYKHEEFDFFFEANKYLERDDGYALNAGIGYRF